MGAIGQTVIAGYLSTHADMKKKRARTLPGAGRTGYHGGMRGSWTYVVALACGMGVLSWVGAARAADGGAADAGPPTMSPGAVLAYYCGEAELQCAIAPVQWEKKVELPIAFDWDTGWIPKNFSELQVRFHVQVPAETVVKMAGNFKTQWPKPLTLGVPGIRYTGLLKFDYGLIVEALGKIDISLLGYHIEWQGPLPYVPNIDFHVLGGEIFDPFAFKPETASASAFTASVDLFEINVLELAGIPSQVAAGGVKLKVKGELKATYWTDQIDITAQKPAEQMVEIPPIKAASATTIHAYKPGKYVEYDVAPDGTVHYDGVLHLIPAFYVEVLGKDFDMPIYDYPITVSLGDQDFKFSPVRVHVSLPDVVPPEQKTYNFGKVVVGSSKKATLPISNQGEARARAVSSVEPSMAQIFKVLSSTVEMKPGEAEEIQLRFAPKTEGILKTKLTISSNDPDSPQQVLELVGEGVPEGTDIPEDTEDGGFVPEEPLPGFYQGTEGGCACGTTPGGPEGGWPMWAGFGLLGASMVIRRRRREKN